MKRSLTKINISKEELSPSKSFHGRLITNFSKPDVILNTSGNLYYLFQLLANPLAKIRADLHFKNRNITYN